MSVLNVPKTELQSQGARVRLILMTRINPTARLAIIGATNAIFSLRLCTNVQAAAQIEMHLTTVSATLKLSKMRITSAYLVHLSASVAIRIPILDVCNAMMRRARALQTALASKAHLMIRFTQSASLALPNAKNVNQPWITAMSAKRIELLLLLVSAWMDIMKLRRRYAISATDFAKPALMRQLRVAHLAWKTESIRLRANARLAPIPVERRVWPVLQDARSAQVPLVQNVPHASTIPPLTPTYQNAYASSDSTSMNKENAKYAPRSASAVSRRINACNAVMNIPS